MSVPHINVNGHLLFLTSHHRFFTCYLHAALLFSIKVKAIKILIKWGDGWLVLFFVFLCLSNFLELTQDVTQLKPCMGSTGWGCVLTYLARLSHWPELCSEHSLPVVAWVGALSTPEVTAGAGEARSVFLLCRSELQVSVLFLKKKKLFFPWKSDEHLQRIKLVLKSFHRLQLNDSRMNLSDPCSLLFILSSSLAYSSIWN